MNALDRLIGWVSPAAALRRSYARSVLAQYEAAEPSRLRKLRGAGGSQNEMVQRSALALRAQARYLARNHDLARGALRTIVNNVVGPRGIGIEPQPRRADGSIDAEYAAALLEAWRDWVRAPEVTHQLSFAALQRAMVRAWVRDGDVFAQLLIGPRADLDHGTRVPLSLEAFEADLVPFDLRGEGPNILQGIERNDWGRPVALHVLKSDVTSLSITTGAQTKRIPWERVIQLISRDHIGQIRGVSEFASVITRLDDIKDYEESERVAAKVAAALTAYVRKGTPQDFGEQGAKREPREMRLSPGMIIDSLGPGEEIGMIDSKRPNPNVVTFRQGQLRAVAAGLGASYSSIARDYGGTYSAQRQELVEQWGHYAVLTDEFVGQFVQPVWETFVATAHQFGVVRMPAGLKPGTHDDAVFVAQSMPWIDPLKEALGAEALVKAGFASEVEMIRRRGANPDDVLEQIAKFRRKADELGLRFSTQADAAIPADPSGSSASEDNGVTT